MRNIGAHVSTAGGILNAISKAKDIGASSIQIFSRPPQQWKGRELDTETALKFREEATKSQIGPVFIHGIYLINLATDNLSLRESSVSCLIDELHVADQIGAEGVIFHLGSHKEGWLGAKREELLKTFERILQSSSQSTLLVENVTATGSKIGTTLAQLAQMKEDLKSPRIKFCLDTAHLFESGYDLRTKNLVETFAKEVERTITWENVLAIHCNDSKTDLGSNLDRHENIGEGKIGIEGFSALLNLPETKNIPFIIETPGFDNKGPDKKNLDILKGLVEASV